MSPATTTSPPSRTPSWHCARPTRPWSSAWPSAPAKPRTPSSRVPGSWPRSATTCCNRSMPRACSPRPFATAPSPASSSTWPSASMPRCVRPRSCWMACWMSRAWTPARCRPRSPCSTRPSCCANWPPSTHRWPPAAAWACTCTRAPARCAATAACCAGYCRTSWPTHCAIPARAGSCWACACVATRWPCRCGIPARASPSSTCARSTTSSTATSSPSTGASAAWAWACRSANASRACWATAWTHAAEAVAAACSRSPYRAWTACRHRRRVRPQSWPPPIRWPACACCAWTTTRKSSMACACCSGAGMLWSSPPTPWTMHWRGWPIARRRRCWWTTTCTTAWMAWTPWTCCATRPAAACPAPCSPPTVATNSSA